MPQGVGSVPESAESMLLRYSRAVREAGYDYSEIGAKFLDCLTPEEVDRLEQEKKAGRFGVEICNSFIPARLPIFDPEMRQALEEYVDRVLSRSARLGIGIMVFGSGGARSVPRGMDREEAMEKMKDFLRMCNEYGEKYGITIVLEPLNHTECNVFNTVAECAAMVHQLKLPRILLLADAFHTWMEQEDLSVLKEQRRVLTHIHVAEPPERVYPGRDGGAYLKTFARALKEADYHGTVSVECKFMDFEQEIVPALQFLKENFQ